jgi:hypothetical protein
LHEKWTMWAKWQQQSHIQSLTTTTTQQSAVTKSTHQTTSHAKWFYFRMPNCMIFLFGWKVYLINLIKGERNNWFHTFVKDITNIFRLINSSILLFFWTKILFRHHSITTFTNFSEPRSKNPTQTIHKNIAKWTEMHVTESNDHFCTGEDHSIIHGSHLKSFEKKHNVSILLCHEKLKCLWNVCVMWNCKLFNPL